MDKIILLVLVILLNLFSIGCAEENIYLTKSHEDLISINKEELGSIVDEYSSYIIDEIYVDDSKIVGFPSNTTQINKLDIDPNGLGISNYRIIYKNYNDITNAKYGYIIISNGKKVSRVEITINDSYKYSTNLEVGKASMVLIKENLNPEDSSGIRLEVKYFDENNKEL